MLNAGQLLRKSEMSEAFEHRRREGEISQTPIYAAIKRYTRHIGPEVHAILGNLKWVYHTMQETKGKAFDTTATLLIEAFSWHDSPQGHAYWFRIQKIMDEGKAMRNAERIGKLKKTIRAKALSPSVEVCG